MTLHDFRNPIFALAILAIVFLAACGDDSGSSASGNAIPEADPNATLVSQVPVGDVYSDMTVRDANGNVVGVFDPNTGYITLSDGNVVTMNGGLILAISSNSLLPEVSSSSVEVASSSSMTEVSSSSMEVVSSSSSSSAISYGTLTDARDGQFYKTVKIGEQIWMAENLNYDYNGGTAKSYCYNDEPDSCAKYGRLYTWAAAMDSVGVFGDGGKGCGGYGVTCKATYPVRGVCPEGWHLPSDGEWQTLFKTVGGTGVAGTKLKSTSGWDDYDGKSGNGSDKYGFSVLPAGDRRVGGSYLDAGEHAFFWSSTGGSSYNAYYWYFSFDIEDVNSDYDSKHHGFSVRCLRDLN
ncbi:fibrobacter succinogenes major paralogous domain-containing protein [Fibrobacter intestinalis]|uniref:Major paralogous domain-containing protein n=1 Tax=Fibrobacter intestinalis TaxID=28122 RepID=A0A1T4M5I0_9BACT|nr:MULTISPECIES: fibrobacter succinogenes major paralogous domain-containing protein [Fibrobacter]PBC73451.1 uncharacterized protein (TIGR02145 family) [Fibrobacter sp. NR9]SJZ62127.1 major paralogous domain-containing protein [Fibrobacter intestinalis]